MVVIGDDVVFVEGVVVVAVEVEVVDRVVDVEIVLVVAGVIVVVAVDKVVVVDVTVVEIVCVVVDVSTDVVVGLVEVVPVASLEDVTVVGLIVLDVTNVGTERVDGIFETESKVEVPENSPALW